MNKLVLSTCGIAKIRLSLYIFWEPGYQAPHGYAALLVTHRIIKDTILMITLNNTILIITLLTHRIIRDTTVIITLMTHGIIKDTTVIITLVTLKIMKNTLLILTLLTTVIITLVTYTVLQE